MLKSFKPVLLGSVLFAASALCAADSDLERVMKERNLSEKRIRLPLISALICVLARLNEQTATK